MNERAQQLNEFRQTNKEGDSMVPTALTTPVRLLGSIKWFDVGKGFGFAVPDGGGPDVLLHVTSLQRDGFRVAYEGLGLILKLLLGGAAGKCCEY